MATGGRKEGVKSPSQELRETFLRLFNQDAEDFEDFDAYYNSKMNKLIQHYRKMIKQPDLNTI